MTIFKPGDLVVPVDEEQKEEIFRQLDFLISRGETLSLPFVVQCHTGDMVFFENGYSVFSRRVKLFPTREFSLEEWM